MKKVNSNVVLALLVAALCVVGALSVYSPMRFDEQLQKRERAVKERLVRIRYAQEKYRKAHGAYTASFTELVNSGLLADSLKYIPYSERRLFDLTATTVIGKSGRSVPLMECGAKYNDYLLGLDKNRIANLIEQANGSGRYPGLKIGDIISPNDNAGNWE